MIWFLPTLSLVDKAQLHFSSMFRWVASLLLARVLRWGGMISTPDAALQSVMRRSLLDSGCPLHCVDELMDSAHERRWPPGLGTLEMRQQNRRHFENYVCRRIPGICRSVLHKTVFTDFFAWFSDQHSSNKLVEWGSSYAPLWGFGCAKLVMWDFVKHWNQWSRVLNQYLSTYT